MKYILIVFVLIFVCCNAQLDDSNNDQLLLIEKYIYTDICSAYGNYELSSSSNECTNDSLYGKSIVKLSQCTIFQMQPAMFIFDSSSNEIVQQIFTDQNCKNYVDSKFHTIGACNSTCIYGQGMTFKMYIIDQLDIPTSTLVSVTYKSKKCDGNYKDSFIEIDLQFLNYCQAYINSDYPSYSVKTICNSTSQTNYIYGSSTDCVGDVKVEHYPLYNQCGMANNPLLDYIQICN